MADLFTKSSAVISDCGAYRYRLERQWDSGKSVVSFLMLNPSTADAGADDPTIRRCISFAKSWGYGGLIVCNLFALRSTDPKALYAHTDPIGPENDRYILEIAKASIMTICAWGTHGAHQARDRSVYNALEFFDLRALKVTAGGHPGHPLYIAGTAQPKPFYMNDSAPSRSKATP